MDQPKPTPEQVQVDLNALYKRIADVCDGENLPTILLATVAFLKVIHADCIAAGAPIPTDLTEVVRELSEGLLASDATV